ncbi:MAG: hypothetical protein CBC27_05380, partial [Opitutia bacterium TMED67]
MLKESQMKNKWNFALILLVIIKVSSIGVEVKIGLASKISQVVVEAKKLDQTRIGSLMYSDDLNNWFPAASTDQTTLNYNEHPISGRRYFQILETTPPKLSSSLNWKTKLTLPEDKFLIEFKAQDGVWIPPGNNKTKETQWVKFTVLMDDLTTVYFQNGSSIKFHYEFGTKFVPEFDGMSHME